MSGAARLVAVLPFGIDGLFMRRAPSAAGLRFLVESGSPDDRWTRRFLPAEAIVRYRLRAEPGPAPTTAAVLRESDIGLALARRGIAHLLLDVSRSQALHDWARGQRLTLLAPAHAHRRLEDKLWFHRFMRREGIPRPAGGSVDLAAALRLDPRRSWVLQHPGSTGGAGTYVLGPALDVATLAASGALVPGERYLARRFVPGRPYGITLLVTPGRVALSALRLQCYFPPAGGVAEFAGLQWVPRAALPPAALARVERVMTRLGRALHERRFFGLANVDFILTPDDTVRVLECNPRMAASSPHLLHHPELTGGLDAAELLLTGFARAHTWPRRVVTSPIPDTAFEGATLDVLAGSLRARSRPAPASGVVPVPAPSAWRPDPDPATLGPGRAFVYFARPGGGAVPPGTLLANIVADARLFDDAGALLPVARALYARLHAAALA